MTVRRAEHFVPRDFSRVGISPLPLICRFIARHFDNQYRQTKMTWRMPMMNMYAVLYRIIVSTLHQLDVCPKKLQRVCSNHACKQADDFRNLQAAGVYEWAGKPQGNFCGYR